jgi:hypothetical protein
LLTPALHPRDALRRDAAAASIAFAMLGARRSFPADCRYGPAPLPRRTDRPFIKSTPSRDGRKSQFRTYMVRARNLPGVRKKPRSQLCKR